MDATLRLIAEEANGAHVKYGPFTSTHEALGVLIEEVSELREAIRGKSLDVITQEATQVAAVAARLADQCAARDAVFSERSQAW